MTNWLDIVIIDTALNLCTLDYKRLLIMRVIRSLIKSKNLSKMCLFEFGVRKKHFFPFPLNWMYLLFEKKTYEIHQKMMRLYICIVQWKYIKNWWSYIYHQPHQNTIPSREDKKRCWNISISFFFYYSIKAVNSFMCRVTSEIACII